MAVTNTLQLADRGGRAGAVVELLKPITWFPPMWAFACGAVSVRGGSAAWWQLAIGVALVGPLVCGASQAMNDWCDRHVDAVNEPNRPIPSGRLPGRTALAVAWGWSALSLVVAASLGPLGLAVTALALGFAWAYSAPPLRLKTNGWLGNAAVGLTYEGLAWLTGVAVASGGAMPSGRSMALALLYSIGAHGILTLNDFKAVAGDRRFGVGSLPVRLGEARAARVACAVMLAPQLVVIAAMVDLHATFATGAIAVLVLGQLALMRRFLAAPSERALWYSAVGVPVYVTGMMIAATAVRAAGAA